MSASRSPSPPPEPLLADHLLPKDTKNVKGSKQLRDAFKKHLDDQRDYFMGYINHDWVGVWAEHNFPNELAALWKDCTSKNEIKATRKKGLLYRDLELGVDHFATIRTMRDALETEPVWKSLVTLRMMQLNLAGDTEFATTWVQSLKYDEKRLAKLVFESKDGVQGWEKKVVSKTEGICAAYRSSGPDTKLHMKSIGDEVTVLPCPKGHTIHSRCLAGWTSTSKLCPECPNMEQYIL